MFFIRFLDKKLTSCWLWGLWDQRLEPVVSSRLALRHYLTRVFSLIVTAPVPLRRPEETTGHRHWSQKPTSRILVSFLLKNLIKILNVFIRFFRQETIQLLTWRIDENSILGELFLLVAVRQNLISRFSDYYSTRTPQRTRRNNWPKTLVSQSSKSTTGKFLV